ncbi:MAG TPA: hypothetical protein VFV95_12430 [Vicinamibacterales bacterium]|nr:hypothetical protein [Vicinamibacterales bacterium]
MPRPNGHRIARLMLAAMAASSPVFGQTLPPVAQAVSLDGPRIGLTFLSDGIVSKLKENDIRVRPAISQFGWQFEKQFFSDHESGLTAVTEWVVLVGGLEQDVVIPSLSWMVGLRTRDGAEFGIGPNFTPAGTAIVLAGGHTFRAGVMNVPVNVAVVPGRSGLRVSFLTGFNLRRDRAPAPRPVPAPPIGRPGGSIPPPPVWRSPAVSPR